MKYSLEFSINGLPRTINSIGREHWAVKARHAKEWREAVCWAVRQNQKPAKPLLRAKITLTRYSSGKLDFDGIVSSCKPILDGLVDADVISDDSMDVIGAPEYKQNIAPRGKGKITVKVEEI